MSGDEDTEDGVVEEDALDEVEEKDFVELPEVDLDEDTDEVDVNEKLDEPYWDDGRSGLLEMYGLDGRRGVGGAVGGGVGTADDDEIISLACVGFSSSK